MAIVFATFIVFLAVVVGTYWIFVVRPEQSAERAVRGRLRRPRAQKIAASVIKVRERLSGIRFLDAPLSRRRDLIAPITGIVTRSGLRITVGTVVLGCIFCAIVTLVIATELRVPSVAALVVAILAGFVPIAYLQQVAKKRLSVFEEQFPEAVDLMARALRAGHALPTALQMVSEEVPDPIGGEFKQLFDQQNFGMSLPDALRAFADRIPLIDARFFVTAVLTQREMGGNLSEVLDRLAAVIRERFKVKRQVRAVSAHGRITGFVLGMLPPVVATVLFVISPAHMRLLVDDPLGVDMVIIAIVLQVVGVLIMRRILAVEY
jgi:tight adherence protein B